MRIIFKGLFRTDASYPTDRAEAVEYAREAARGLKLWQIIDIVIATGAYLILLSDVKVGVYFVRIIASIILVGPMITTTVFMHVCLKYMSWEEFWKIFKEELF